ncbi:MAG: IS66 family transposase [Bacteroidetes bacterium]|nr:MAG: IS66 family transposase [Bacteroidota bacterium]
MENGPTAFQTRNRLQRPISQPPQLGNRSVSGAEPTDLIRLLLSIIRVLVYTLAETLWIIEWQRREIIELQVRLNKVNRVFSPKNEQFQDGKTTDSISTKKKKRGAQPGHKPTKRNIPKELEKEKVRLDFDAPPCCDSCKKPYKRYTVFDKISHQVRLTISAIHEVVTRFAYKKDCACLGSPKIKIAPQRDSVIKKSILSTVSWVHLIIMKYFLAVPVYRYSQVLKTMGYKLSPGTVENGFKKIGLLLEPVYQALIVELRKEPLWNADETRWKVFELIEGKTSFLWWLWVFASKNIVIYVIDPSRSAEVIRKINNGLSRIIAADRFSAYEAVKKTGDILIAYCWVHLRRDFINLKSDRMLKNDLDVGKWVDDWLSDIKMLFKLNKKRRKSSCEEEKKRLTAEMRSITEELRLQKIEDLKYQFQRKILKSFQKRYSGYTIFIDNPLVPMDNNYSERLLKTGINGRKNYLGNVSHKSVPHTQIFLSIIATAKNNGVPVQKWLEEYLNACAANDSKALEGEDLKQHVERLLSYPS